MTPQSILSQTESLPPLSRLLLGLTVTIWHWEMRAKTRKALEKLDDHLLDDIGISKHDARQEWDKPFWWD